MASSKHNDPWHHTDRPYHTYKPCHSDDTFSFCDDDADNVDNHNQHHNPKASTSNRRTLRASGTEQSV